MKFEFAGETLEGTKIGYVATKRQFVDFLKHNGSEIEEIITDKLEEQKIYQWNELDLDCKVSCSEDDENKHLIVVGNTFIQEESFDENMLVRTVRASIFCITEADLV